MNFFFGIVGLSMILTVAISMLMPMIVAQPPAFSSPVDCEIGKDCFIQNYVDLDPSEGWSDYRCGPLSYDGHKGTDFRTRNLVQMREGVKVIAAADGTVLRLRDGMEDVSIKDPNAPELNGNDCGNGVVIGHNGGFESQYCHLKQASIAVEQGQEVKRGDVLGEIGLSGRTEFPHVHFGLRNKDGEVIDPFAGKMDSTSCDAKGRHSHFWQPSAKRAMPYVPTAMLGYGFTTKRPAAPAARDGAFNESTLPTSADALIFWTDTMGLLAGDRMIMQLVRPDNVAVVNHAQTIEKNKAQWFQFVGKRLTEDQWPEGTYTARYQIFRESDGQKRAIIDETMKIDVVSQDSP